MNCTQGDKIFISYRRDDTAGYAGRLYDRLIHHFGEDRIFRDVEQIMPGQDFVDILESTLNSCKVIIVLIGKQWLALTDSDGNRRIDDENDWVRNEIGTGLKRKIDMIPVLLGSASMPPPEMLPNDLVDFARYQAIEISDSRFEYDVGRLIQIIEQMMGNSKIQTEKSKLAQKKKVLLEKRLANRIEEYEALNKQLDKVLSDADQIRLKRAIADIGEDIRNIENDLKSL